MKKLLILLSCPFIILTGCTSPQIREVEVIKEVQVPVYKCPKPIIPERFYSDKLSIEKIDDKSTDSEVLSKIGITIEELLYQREYLLRQLEQYNK